MIKEEDIKVLGRNETRMVKWMCGVIFTRFKTNSWSSPVFLFHLTLLD